MNKKNMALFSSIIVSAGVLAACGSDEGAKEDTQGTDDVQQEQPADISETLKAMDPSKDDTCYYCQMGIPHPGEEGSEFTAQAITADGDRVFFDDSGCVENAEAEEGEEFTKVWVKDYETDEWIDMDGTSVVYDESLKTPMSYHYAFFQSDEDAEAYVEANDAELSNWEDVQADAKERAGGSGDMDMDSSDHEGMEMENNDGEGMDHEDSEGSHES